MINSPLHSFTYKTRHGKFIISPKNAESNHVNLTLREPSGSTQILDVYTSINDAFQAVTNQQTGYFPWDTHPYEDVPYQMHDLICWQARKI